jgi:hypothetical protein
MAMAVSDVTPEYMHLHVLMGMIKTYATGNVAARQQQLVQKQRALHINTMTGDFPELVSKHIHIHQQMLAADVPNTTSAGYVQAVIVSLAHAPDYNAVYQTLSINPSTDFCKFITAAASGQYSRLPLPRTNAMAAQGAGSHGAECSRGGAGRGGRGGRMRRPTSRPAGHVGPWCTHHGVGTPDNAGGKFLRNLAASHQAAAAGVDPADFVNNDVAGHAALCSARHQPNVYLDSAAVSSFFPSANVF